MPAGEVDTFMAIFRAPSGWMEAVKTENEQLK